MNNNEDKSSEKRKKKILEILKKYSSGEVYGKMQVKKGELIWTEVTEKGTKEYSYRNFSEKFFPKDTEVQRKKDIKKAIEAHKRQGILKEEDIEL